MLRLLYSFFFTLALPFVFIKLYLRGRKAPDYRKRWAERLGFCPFQLDHCIWIHAVSMGETIAVTPLVKALIAEHPHQNYVITTMTPTGSEQVKKLYKNESNVWHCYVPYDVPCLLKRFLKRIKPELLVIVETELWPNMLHHTHQYGAKTVLANARLSQRSADGYRKVAWVSRQMFANIDKIAAQTQADAQRFISIGYPAANCMTCGNLKYDIHPDPHQVEQAKTFRSQLNRKHVWIAASTHQGEDEVVFQAHQTLLKAFPEALLIIVPRHPERFGSVTKLTQQQFNTVTRTDQQGIEEAKVLVGDTMGELIFYYSVSDVVFVGGSLVEHGGQNMLEPAALKKPIMCGPHLFNFAKVSELMEQAGGMSIINNAKEMADQLNKWFHDPDSLKQQGINAFGIVQQNQGAMPRQLDLIKGMIGQF